MDTAEYLIVEMLFLLEYRIEKIGYAMNKNKQSKSCAPELFVSEKSRFNVLKNWKNIGIKNRRYKNVRLHIPRAF